jgi:hypothetical protein
MATEKRIPAARFIKQNPSLSALLSKLVNNKVKEKDFVNEGESYNVMTQTASLQAISKDIQESAKNTESIASLFPDMELSMQILISSIISPKDMTGDELIYKVDNNFLTPDITNSLIDVIKTEFETYYNIREDLPAILREVLFISGAYTVAIIPESELDLIINSKANISTESLKNKVLDNDHNFYNIGILGEPTQDQKVSYSKAFESLDKVHDFTFNRHNTESKLLSEDSKVNNILSYFKENGVDEDTLENYKIIFESIKNISITDNPDFLKMPSIMKKKMEYLSKTALATKYKRYGNLAREEFDQPPTNVDISKIRDSLYKNPSTKPTPFMSFVNLKPTRASIGRPLIMRLPTESIIPVHTPGEPNNHIGYFILVDHNGSPVHMIERITALTELDEGLMEPDTSMNSILVQRAQDNIRGKNIKGMSIDNSVPIYTNLIEQELLARLENGIYGKNVEIAKVNDIYRIMLARTLKNQMTKLVYVPKEMVEYFRYKIHPNGVGKALSEDLRILLSIRAMMLFSRLMGSIKNSIGITEINLKLDERDPDPLKTIEITKNEILRARQQNFPIGISTPMDLADWVQRSGLEFTFEGHPRIPDVKIGYDQHGASNIMPDESLDDDLRKRTIMSYGLSPESVDAGFTAEFATTVVNNNILLSKRVIVIQKTILGHIKSLLSKIVLSDSIIKNKLIEVLKSNMAEIKTLIKNDTIDEPTLIDFIIDEFIDILSIELPLPNSATINSQMQSFLTYQEFLDKALDAWVSTEMYTDTLAGKLNTQIDSIKAVIKSYYTRKWMTENGVMEELGDISEDLSSNSLFNAQSEFMMKIMKNATSFIANMQKMTKAINKDFSNYDISTDGGMGGSEEGGNEFGDEFSDLGGEGTEEETTEGTEEGLEEGFKEGSEEGFQEGLEEGSEEPAEEI